ncbi:hypothetical protein [Hungatella hathewayi]|uniref:hypothetical protein n=1 Tax=Hungatella hathewayi TaxID=154046 RepID=UPI003561AD95
MSGNDLPDKAQGMSCSNMATELFEIMGKDYCVGLIIHLTMYVSGSYGRKESINASKKEK